MARYRIVPEQSRVWIDARSSVHPIRSATDGLEGYRRAGAGQRRRLGRFRDAVGQALVAGRAGCRRATGWKTASCKRRIEAHRYPTIVGVLQEIRPIGHRGELPGRAGTSPSVARPAQDEMTIRPLDDQTIQLAGKSRFDIRDFGMEPPRVLMLTVEPEVDVRVEILAMKES